MVRHEAFLATAAMDKDALIAGYNARIARWHLLQGSAPAVVGVTAVALLTGQLSRAAFVLITVGAAAAVGLAPLALAFHEGQFERALFQFSGHATGAKVDAERCLTSLAMAEPDLLDAAEHFDDILQEFRHRTGLPLERWLINRRRRREGRAPFT